MTNNKTTINISEEILESWQEMTDILAEMLSIPVALIMRYTNPDIEVFVSSHSKGNPYHPGDKEILKNSGLYCERVITTQKKLLVPDALSNPEWESNPDVKLNMISYLGFPINLPNKEPFGTLCILDNAENNYSESVEKLMMKFRSLIEFNLEGIQANQMLGDRNKRLSDYLNELQTLRGIITICSNCKSIEDNQGHWQPIERYLIKTPNANFTHGICPECMASLYPDHDKDLP